MADNLRPPAGWGNGAFAFDEINGVYFLRVKLAVGADGAHDGDASSGTPVPVSGTVDLGATDNAVLDDIKAAVELLDNVVSGSEAQVDVVTSALPSGAATAANQSTANTALSAIQTAVEILDNIVSGSEAQVDVVTQPARDRTTDNMGVALQTDALMDDVTALTPKFAAIDAASSGDNTLVSAVSGKKIRVLAAFLQAAGTVNCRFEDGAGGTALTGQMNNVANTGFVLPFNPLGWFETSANTLLNLELSGAVSVDGCLTYVEV